jgi:hypothetical protein
MPERFLEDAKNTIKRGGEGIAGEYPFLEGTQPRVADPFE